MSWLFLILILSTMAVVCVGVAIYLRIRRHMKEAKGSVSDMEHGSDSTAVQRPQL